MTKIDLLNMLTRDAKVYRKDAAKSIIRNRHMNTCPSNQIIDPVLVDALLTDFINYVGAVQGVDYALYTSDLNKE
jgi:hypothetical protein